MPNASSPRTWLGAWRRRDFLLAAGSLYLLAAAATLVHQQLRLQNYTADLTSQRVSVDMERRQLQRQLSLYGKAEGIERLARQHLGLGRADEVPVRFVNGGNLPDTQVPTSH